MIMVIYMYDYERQIIYIFSIYINCVIVIQIGEICFWLTCVCHILTIKETFKLTINCLVSTALTQEQISAFKWERNTFDVYHGSYRH